MLFSIQGDLDGYKSEEDPDYEPESDEESVDESVADEVEEILRYSQFFCGFPKYLRT